MPKEEKALAEIRLWTTDYSTYEDEEILGLIEERAGFVLDSFDSETILKEIKLAKKTCFHIILKISTNIKSSNF